MKTKPKVGDTLYLRWKQPYGKSEGNGYAVEVIKVGRKYFTIDYRKRVFHLEDWREKTEYSSWYRLYLSEQEWKDEIEFNDICKRLSYVFRSQCYRIDVSLDTLRKIEGMIVQKKAPDRAGRSRACGEG